MFRYLISPENTDKIYMIAFTIYDDTITVYTQSKYSPSWEIFAKEKIAFERCLQGAIGDYEYDRYVVHNDIDHKLYHSRADYSGEVKVSHYHIKHRKQIQMEYLKEFLKKLNMCKAFEGNLNHKMIKDILLKYKAFYEEQRRLGMEDYTSSNNPIYSSEIPIPSINQHAKCLRMPDKVGCNVTTPALIAAGGDGDALTPLAPVVIPVLLTVGMLAFCMFGKKSQQHKIVKSEAKPDVRQEKLERQKKHS